MPHGFSKGGREEEGSLHCFTKILLAMKEKGKKKERNSHKARVCNLSELIETWPMRVSFVHRASGVLIAPNGRRDNYKMELKKGK
jgi:hypothetical protein